MNASASFLAVDLGASSGRVMDCRWDGSRFTLDEVHRFANGGVAFGSSLHWDVRRLWAEIKSGLRRFKANRNELPAGIGVDSWGVDFGLLDEQDRLIGNPYHYRDSRTHGMPEAMQLAMSGRELFNATGVLTMEINTCFQLAAMARQGDAQLESARTLLMIPDLFAFFLCGQKRAEYTEATTTEIYDVHSRCWSPAVIERFGLPARIFQPVALPGIVLGPVLPAVQAECGFAGGFPAIVVASHDTASAVAAIPELDAQSAFLSSGTWSLMGVAVEEPVLSDEVFTGGFTNEGSADGRVLLLKNMTGLWILQECVRAWAAAGKQSTWAELEAAAAQAEAFRCFIDPSNPSLQAPADMPAAVGAYCKRTGQPVPQTPGEMARCVFESLSFSYRAVLEELEQVTGRVLSTVRAVGGGALNRFLCQMTADACERQVAAGPVEAAALGNAMAQAVATGHLASLAEGRQAMGRSVEREHYAPTRADAWREGFERYKSVIARGRAL